MSIDNATVSEWNNFAMKEYLKRKARFEDVVVITVALEEGSYYVTTAFNNKTNKYLTPGELYEYNEYYFDLAAHFSTDIDEDY